MLLFSLFLYTFNIADISHFGLELIQSLAEKCSFLQISKGSAYLLEPKPIEACEYQSVKNISLTINYEIIDWQQEQKLNSGENKHLITFFK